MNVKVAGSGEKCMDNMKSEDEIGKQIDRLEQLKEKHNREGDYSSKLDVSNSIRLLGWVLTNDSDDTPDEGYGRKTTPVEIRDTAEYMDDDYTFD